MKLTWKSWLVFTAAVLGILFVLDARVNAKATTSNQSEFTFDVSAPVSPVLSAAVRDLTQTGRETYLAREVNPIQWLGEGVGLSGPSIGLDPLVGRSINGGVSPDPLVTFEGVPSVSGVTPPDTNGDVGPNHYIQMTNFSFQIWDKGDPNNAIPPTPLTGPILTGNLFAPLGGQCASNFGDPIVVYDDMADRWLLTQFGLSSPLAMCLAVSTTPDPLGSYYLYEIPTPDFPDYPKFGAWPDAYYMTTNTGFPNAYYAHAFDRVAMLAGAPATRQSFGGLPNLMLPADVDGPVPPPAGDPGIFYTYFHPSATGHPPGAERLAFYEFDVDWVTPANSTYTLVAELPVAPFNYTICGFFAGGCIQQPGTGQLLDDIAWWPMHRMQYRNFGGYEAMVGNFTVDADGANHAGIRWFEVHKTGNTYSLYQEGTHFPDTDSRWMGSIAMDISGNLALGYSVSSGTTIPSIRYATRLAGDPLGTLNAEAEMWAGGGVQTGIHRWGDYSAMTVDPVDGCTFWFTTEYHDINDSGFGWNTRVGIFRIPSCGGPSGTLTGQVVDSVTNNGIPGAAVQATASITKTGFTTTDANGYYTMTLLEGSYYVTATAFAYLPDSVSGVNIISGTTTTQDFALTPAANVVVEGYVTDDLMDWPLYARIDIGGGYPGGPVWTDPVSGYYSVTLPVGVYPFEVSAFVEGYTPQTTIVTVTGVINAPTGISLPVTPAFNSPLPDSAMETVDEADAEAPSVVSPLSDFRVPNAVLYDNGPLVTHPGAGAGGADESRLQNSSLGMTTIGFGHQVSANNRVADDFTITDPGGWDIDNIVFYAYQTGSTTASTITAVNVQIWDGPPNAGGTVIWGDTTTNVMTDTVWSNIYRVTETTIGNTQRPIMANTVAVGGLHLDPGTYWVDWQTNGTLASGPWAPPITIVGQAVTGNGLQSLAGVWGPALDGGIGNPAQGFPFTVLGTVAPPPSAQTANFALPADLNVCSAPGYTPVPSGGFFDDFESGYGNWTMTGLWNAESQTDTCGSLVAPFPSPTNAAYYGIDGTCTFNNGGTNSGELTLNTPIAVGAGSILTFSSYEQTECNGDCTWDNRYIEISTNGGGSWNTIAEGNTENTWTQYNLDLSAYAGSALIRFRFDTVDGIANDFLGWMIDDVSINTYACLPPSGGGLVVGNVYDLNTLNPVNGAWVTNETGSIGYAMETPLDPAVDDAFYTVYSLSGSQVHTATYTLYGEDVQTVNVVDFETVEQDFYLPSGYVVIDPDNFNVTLEIGQNATYAMTMTDIGGANVEFIITEVPGTNPYGPNLHLPASDGNFLRGTAPTSMGAVPTSGKPVTGPRSTLAELLGSSAYSIDHANLFYTIFDVDIPEVLPNLGAMPPTGGFIGAGELVGDKVYMIDTLNSMWEVDAATGTILNTYTATPPGGGETYSGLALDPTSGTVYAATTSCGASSLYTIDAPTGAATLVGPVTNGGCLIGIAIDGNGDLWGYDIISDVLLWIDKNTGAGTIIGSIGFDANFGQGMGWDPATDTLYMAAFNNGTFVPELRAVDRTTGNTTLIGVLGQTDPGGLSQLPWLGFEISGSGSGGWAYAVPDFGSVPPFSSTTFELVFDARSLYQTGDYFAELSFSGNFANDPGTMPLTMHVSCPACGFLVGDIYDDESFVPVEANVYVSSSNGTAITLTNVASYSLALQPGSYDFLVTADGYFSETATVEVDAGETVVTDFALTQIVAILEYSPSAFERTVALGQVFTDTLVLSNSGTVAYDFFLSDVGIGGPGILAPVTTCPEDAYGYTCTDSNEPGGPTYNFEDISGTGTQLFLSDDSMSAALPLGFTFNYYDIDYTDAYVSSNGFITFLAGQYNGCCTGEPLPTPGDPDGLIAAWWEDINPSAGGSIYYETLGSAPNRVFIVQFSNVPHYPSGNDVTFQYKLFEGTDQIEIHYQAAPSDGGTHSAGIENETGTVGLQYYYGGSGLTTPLAVRYGRATDALWLLELPATGTVNAGESSSVSLIFDASVITQTGTYTAELRFDGTFDNAVAPTTVVMHVIDNPVASVDISDSAGVGEPDTVVTHTMWITNTGNFADIFDLSIAGNTWATDISATTVVLDPGEAVYVMCFVTIPASAADGDTDTVSVTVTSRFDNSGTDTATATTEANIPEPPTYELYLPIVKNE